MMFPTYYESFLKDFHRILAGLTREEAIARLHKSDFTICDNYCDITEQSMAFERTSECNDEDIDEIIIYFNSNEIVDKVRIIEYEYNCPYIGDENEYTAYVNGSYCETIVF